MSATSSLNFQGIPLDIKSMAFDMAEGCLTELKEIFFLEGKYPPVIRWCSYAHGDWPKPHQILSQYWRDHFYIDQFSLEEFLSDPATSPIAPYIVHFKGVDSGDSFKYNFIGDKVKEFMETRGSITNDLLAIAENTQTANDLFNIVCLLACSIRGQGMIILAQDGTEEKPVLWNKMIVPLIDRSGKVVEILSCVLRMPPR